MTADSSNTLISQYGRLRSEGKTMEAGRVFSDIYKKYRNYAISICLKKMSSDDHGDLEDIIQVVFVKIFRYEKCEIWVPDQTLVRRICINTIADKYRKKTPDLTLDEPVKDGSGFRIDHVTENADQNLIDSHDIKESLVATLNSIPESQKEALLMSIEGYTNREISEMTGSPMGTVANRLKFAKEKLSQHVSQN